MFRRVVPAAEPRTVVTQPIVRSEALLADSSPPLSAAAAARSAAARSSPPPAFAVGSPHVRVRQVECDGQGCLIPVCCLDRLQQQLISAAPVDAVALV